MPDPPAKEQLNQDLGLGGRMSERSPTRLLNHDGSFNVRRNELGPLHPYNAYHTLLSLPPRQLLILVTAFYFGTNLLFAALYWLPRPGGLSGALRAARRIFHGC